MTQVSRTGATAVASTRLQSRTELGARLRWMAGMLKAFAGEAAGNAEMELDGTLSKLIGRMELDNFARRRALGEAPRQHGAECEPELYDISLHERAASRLELAAQRHRRAVRCYRIGDREQGHYHAFVAQRFFSDASKVVTTLGKALWRSLERGR